MDRILPTAFLGVLLAFRAVAAPPADGREVEKFTGGHTRAVWTEDVRDNRDFMGRGNSSRLMGYDSRDGKGARVILKGPANYHFPMFTPDGKRIVFSDYQKNAIHVVDWDGAGLKTLKKRAVAAEVWRDPKSGKAWVYAQKNLAGKGAPIVRFPLANPEREEKVWTRSPIEALPPGAFQLTRDGTRAAAAFPWPNLGVADLTAGDWKKHRDGCWPSMAPDNSGLAWAFDGPHRNVIMTDEATGNTWTVGLSQAPNVNGFEVYHPRWTNDVNFMVMTGPYVSGGGGNRISQGGDGVNLYLGKFSDDFSKIAQWLQLTDTKQAEFMPDVWIEGGERKSSSFAQERNAGAKTTPPAERAGGLVFLWNDNRDANEYVNFQNEKRSQQVKPLGSARFGPAGQMHLFHGICDPDPDGGEASRNAFAVTGQFSIAAIVTPGGLKQNPPAAFLRLAGDGTDVSLALGQHGDRLAIRVVTEPTKSQDVVFGTLQNAPTLVLVTYRDGELACYQDGKLAAKRSIGKIAFDKWTCHRLVFGSDDWHGWLDSVVILNRSLEDSEIRDGTALAARRVASRPKIVRHHVRARLADKQEPPSPASIAPYRRALVINRYEVVDGPAELKSRKIAVAEWALLDATVPATYAAARPGETFDLELETFDANPQLESERLAGEAPAVDEDLYYNVVSGR